MTTSLSPWEYAAQVFEASRGFVSDWPNLARPSQLPPPLYEEWLIWLFLAGRGAGKTRSAAEAVAQWMRDYPGCRVALIGTTIADARDVMVEGDSGLLGVLDDTELRGGNRDDAWNRSMGELFMANGSSARTFSSEKPGKLRGPQHHFVWADEAAAWRDAHRDPSVVDTTWSNAMLGLRLPKSPSWDDDYAPRAIVTTTPRKCALLHVSPEILRAEPHRSGLTQLPNDVVRITKGTTFDNLANLADAFRRAVVDPLKGTRLGRQELDGELLTDVSGSLIHQGEIDPFRVRQAEVMALMATVTGVDPATTSNENSDETGIVTVGVDAAGDGYVLGDVSGRYRPEEWAEKVWQSVLDHSSSAVVVEDNAGGDMVEHVLRNAWGLMVRNLWASRGQQAIPMPPIVRVHPTGAGQGKWARAQPVAALYQQGRIHHVIDEVGSPAHLGPLEDQLTSWTGTPSEPSPDRVDALVHGLSWLLFPGQRRQGKGGTRPPTAHPGRWAADRRR